MGMVRGGEIVTCMLGGERPGFLLAAAG
jgi:hypothetical protein